MRPNKGSPWRSNPAKEDVVTSPLLQMSEAREAVTCRLQNGGHWEAAIAPWFRLRLQSYGPWFESQTTLFQF